MATVRKPRAAGEENRELLADTERAVEVSDDRNKADDLSNLPVDRGWAWMILTGAFLQVFVYGGVLKSYGVFFVQFQQRFGSSASETTLVQTVFNMAISVSGIFVMTIGLQHMTARTSICIGGLLTSVAYAASAFARHIEVLVFTLGAVAGVSASMIFLPIVSNISIYFNKHRGMANSLNMAGASLGALVFGPLYSILFDYYGYTGTMLISSGFILNILITACLMRPPEFYNKRNSRQSSKTEQELQALAKIKTTSVDNDKFKGNGAIVSEKSTPINSEHINDLENLNGTDATKDPTRLLLRTISGPPSTHIPLGTRTRAFSFDPYEAVNRKSVITYSARKRTVSERNQTPEDFIVTDKGNLSLYSNVDYMCGSLVSLRSANLKPKIETREQVNETPSNHTTKTCCSSVQTKVITFLRTVFDPSILRDRVFIHFIILSFVSFAPAVITPVYIVPFAKDIGISTDNINVLLIVFGSTDLISRVSVGIVADRKWLKPSTIVGLAFIILCVVVNMSHVIKTFWAMLIFVVIQSALAGVYIALFAVILVENLGIEKFKSSLGFTNMSHGASGAIFFPITGLMRDVSGAYYWTYHLLSILLIIGAALAFTLPLTHRRSRKHTAELSKEIIAE